MYVGVQGVFTGFGGRRNDEDLPFLCIVRSERSLPGSRCCAKDGRISLLLSRRKIVSNTLQARALKDGSGKKKKKKTAACTYVHADGVPQHRYSCGLSEIERILPQQLLRRQVASPPALESPT